MFKLYQVDAFTDKPFAGNPAAICLLKSAADESWMQNVAMEMNLSETAFVVPQGEGWDLRWFTPKAEVPLCGHATLASAHTLWESGALGLDSTAIFYTKSGQLTATRSKGWIHMNFPARPVELCEPPEGLSEALGAIPIQVSVGVGPKPTWLIEFQDEQTLRGLTPDFEALSRVENGCAIVTSASKEPDIDFISRFFAPCVGINEDPVTGSAHCCLTPYWSAKLNKKELTGYQASKRGGIVKVRLSGDRVVLSGQAVTVMTGTLFA